MKKNGEDLRSEMYHGSFANRKEVKGKKRVQPISLKSHPSHKLIQLFEKTEWELGQK